jgi:hypothetical protein
MKGVGQVKKMYRYDALASLNAALLEALEALIDVGKRDMTNPKYDGYFESAKQAIALAKEAPVNRG